jgi:GT2 family glycosyltransferase
MSEGDAIWVGCFDLDGAGPIAGPTGPVRSTYSRARVMVRLHKAPLGYIHVPVEPENTLVSRVRAAAATTLAEPLRRHLDRDRFFDGLANSGDWTANVACPRHFPASGGSGLSIVICTRNRAESLRVCLRALQRTTFTPVEILVVDNAPISDETRNTVIAAAAADGRVHYTREPQAGLSRARNHGLTHARFEIVAFTDDDTMADPDWAAVLAAGFAADPETVCVTGLVASGSLDTGCERYFDSRYSWGKEFEARQYDLAEHRHPSRFYPFRAGMFGTGANFAVRRRDVAAIGGFDPLLGAGGPGLGGEDLDMFLRIILAGGRISYLPSALVWHKHRADTAALAEQVFSYGHGLGAYLAKHLSSSQLRTQLLAKGLPQARGVSIRMRQAVRESQLQSSGRRLVADEVRGVAIGALHYRQAARQASQTLSGV